MPVPGPPERSFAHCQVKWDVVKIGKEPFIVVGCWYSGYVRCMMMSSGMEKEHSITSWCGCGRGGGCAGCFATHSHTHPLTDCAPRITIHHSVFGRERRKCYSTGSWYHSSILRLKSPSLKYMFLEFLFFFHQPNKNRHCAWHIRTTWTNISYPLIELESCKFINIKISLIAHIARVKHHRHQWL